MDGRFDLIVSVLAGMAVAGFRASVRPRWRACSRFLSAYSARSVVVLDMRDDWQWYASMAIVMTIIVVMVVAGVWIVR
jgi:hypothetical protein